MDLDLPTRSSRLLQREEPLKIVSGTNVDGLHMQRSKLIIFDNLYLASGENIFKLLFGLIQCFWFAVS